MHMDAEFYVLKVYLFNGYYLEIRVLKNFILYIIHLYYNL